MGVGAIGKGTVETCCPYGKSVFIAFKTNCDFNLYQKGVTSFLLD